MDLVPTYNTVLVRPFLAGEKKLSSGILLPSTIESNLQEGEVVAVGDGSWSSSGVLLPMDVKVGDVVVINPAAPHQAIREDGVSYLFIRAEFVLAYRHSVRAELEVKN